VQEFPRATLIGATWVDGPSVREQTSKTAGVGASSKRAKPKRQMG